MVTAVIGLRLAACFRAPEDGSLGLGNSVNAFG
jgi:hypothetical protein